MDFRCGLISIKRLESPLKNWFINHFSYDFLLSLLPSQALFIERYLDNEFLSNHYRSTVFQILSYHYFLQSTTLIYHLYILICPLTP